MKTVDEVCAWLEAQGFGRWIAAFRDNEIDGEILETLDEADLEKLDIPLGPRRKLLRALAGAAASPPAAATTRDAERRQLTVMFVDLVGSTALSSRLDPEEMGEVLRAYQNAVAGEIGRLEGHVAKLMGDGVLAYFGWPRAHEDEAERAVRAGLAIVAAVSRLTGGSEPLTCRVGIATGLVVVGDLIGEGASREEAVVGETPNLAARLQAWAGPGEVVVADGTRRLLGEVFELTPLVARELKGLGEAVPAFAVRGERSSESRFAARPGASRSPLVGRDGEMAVLLERWNAARAGQGQLVMLVGEAGLGKSRIVQAVVDTVPGDHVRVTYQCSPYHGESTLYPAIQQLGRAAGMAADDDAETRLDKLEALLRHTTGLVDEHASLLAALLGLEVGRRFPKLSLTPAQQRARTLEALLDQLGALARQQPVLWVIEDAHWIDPTTQELVELALERVAQSRVLVLVTARPTFSHGFGGHPIVTRLSLNRLGREPVSAIVGRITRGKPLPPALLEEIAARTDGVPLFVEEMTKTLLETGMLRETATDWQLDAPLAQLAIPTTLHDSLMARLDRLQPVKEVAQTAAVIGRAFDHATLALLSTLPPAELTQALDRLVAAELVFRRGVAPDATYLFKHALVRDAAYESMLKSRRQPLHLRLLEVLQAGGAAPPELLAQHAQAGGDTCRAVGWWRAAGEAAVGRAAFEEAEAHLNAAHALLPALDDLALRRHAEAGIAVARAHASLVRNGYGHDRTRDLYAQADILASATDDSWLVMLAQYGVWAVDHVREDVAPALAGAERMVDEAERRSDGDLSMIAYRLLGSSQTMAGRLNDACSTFEHGRALCDPSRCEALAIGTGTDPIVAVNCYQSLAELARGYPDRARAMADTAWERSQAVEQVNARAYAAYHVGLTAAFGRVSARALTLGAGLVATAAAHNLTFWEALAGSIIAFGRLEGGDAAGALLEMTRSLAAAEASGSGLFGALSRSVLGEALAATGDVRALSVADDAETLARHTGALYGLAEIQRRQGVVLRLLRPDDVAAAEAAFRRALGTADGQAARLWQLRAARDLARLLADRGRRAEARDLLAPIHGWFTEGFDTPDLIEAKALLDQLR